MSNYRVAVLWNTASIISLVVAAVLVASDWGLI